MSLLIMRCASFGCEGFFPLENHGLQPPLDANITSTSARDGGIADTEGTPLTTSCPPHEAGQSGPHAAKSDLGQSTGRATCEGPSASRLTDPAIPLDTPLGRPSACRHSLICAQSDVVNATTGPDEPLPSVSQLDVRLPALGMEGVSGLLPARAASESVSNTDSGRLNARTETVAQDSTTLPVSQPVLWAIPERFYARGRPSVSTEGDGRDVPAPQQRSLGVGAANATAGNTSSGNTPRPLVYEVFVGGLCVYSGRMPPTCESHEAPEPGQPSAELGCSRDRSPKMHSVVVPSEVHEDQRLLSFSTALSVRDQLLVPAPTLRGLSFSMSASGVEGAPGGSNGYYSDRGGKDVSVQPQVSGSSQASEPANAARYCRPAGQSPELGDRLGTLRVTAAPSSTVYPGARGVAPWPANHAGSSGFAPREEFQRRLAAPGLKQPAPTASLQSPEPNLGLGGHLAKPPTGKSLVDPLYPRALAKADIICPERDRGHGSPAAHLGSSATAVSPLGPRARGSGFGRLSPAHPSASGGARRSMLPPTHSGTGLGEDVPELIRWLQARGAATSFQPRETVSCSSCPGKNSGPGNCQGKLRAGVSPVAPLSSGVREHVRPPVACEETHSFIPDRLDFVPCLPAAISSDAAVDTAGQVPGVDDRDSGLCTSPAPQLPLLARSLMWPPPSMWPVLPSTVRHRWMDPLEPASGVGVPLGRAVAPQAEDRYQLRPVSMYRADQASSGSPERFVRSALPLGILPDEQGFWSEWVAHCRR